MRLCEFLLDEAEDETFMVRSEKSLWPVLFEPGWLVLNGMELSLIQSIVEKQCSFVCFLSRLERVVTEETTTVALTGSEKFEAWW